MGMIAGDRRPVVAGVDPSDSARDAAEWAADLAAARGAPLQLVHVVPERAANDALPSWLKEVRDAAERAGSDVRLVEVTPGAAVDVLAEHAAMAQLLVLGSYGEGAVSGMLAGSVAAELLATAACPVAVVRRHAALMLAARYAQALGARLVGVRTWADVIPGPHGGTHRRRADKRTLAGEAGRVLDAELEAVIAGHPGLPVERVLIADTPLRGLLERATSARMLVVGHRGHNQVDGMLMGSTSTGLAEFAPCPVVVVKAAPVTADRPSGQAGGTTVAP